ncbi:MAG: hypothetical protein M4579_007554, partial [Chaenotheca gracillima]
MNLSDLTFKTLMRHIHKLKEGSPTLACEMLQELLTTRLVDAENQEWIEQALITRIWISTTIDESADSVESLQSLLTSLFSDLTKPLSAASIHAAQVLLWKKVEFFFAQSLWDKTSTWCRLALHSIFRNAGDLNKAKILRKIMACAISKSDFNTAQDAFEEMAEEVRAEPLTLYLMFKMAARSGQTEL